MPVSKRGSMNKRMTIQMNMDEYVETWTDIISSLHDQIISEDDIYLPLSSKAEPYKISFELKTILLIIAMQSFREAVMHAKVKDSVENEVVDKIYASMSGSDTDALISSKEYYHGLMDFFRENRTFKKDMIGEEKAEALQNDTVSQARYFVSRLTDEKEEKLKDLITKVGVALIKARAVFSQLTASSAIDANSMLFKKYRFYVKG